MVVFTELRKFPEKFVTALFYGTFSAPFDSDWDGVQKAQKRNGEKKGKVSSHIWLFFCFDQ